VTLQSVDELLIVWVALSRRSLEDHWLVNIMVDKQRVNEE